MTNLSLAVNPNPNPSPWQLANPNPNPLLKIALGPHPSLTKNSAVPSPFVLTDLFACQPYLTLQPNPNPKGVSGRL